jgi:hypothetical protein
MGALPWGQVVVWRLGVRTAAFSPIQYIMIVVRLLYFMFAGFESGECSGRALMKGGSVVCVIFFSKLSHRQVVWRGLQGDIVEVVYF